MVFTGCGGSTKPEEHGSDLLTDEEMQTANDPNAPEENPNWTEWIVANNIPVRSLTSSESSDLKALAPFLEGKRIVQLGESGHGISQFSSIKVRLIKFLHEQMDFDVIAFESGLFDCRHVDESMSSKTSEEMVQSSIFPVWHCSEILPLFEYIKESQSGNDPLTLAGFDIQFSSPTSREFRPAFFKDIVARFNTGYADHIFDIDQELTGRFNEEGYITSNVDRLIDEYEALADSIAAHKEELVEDPAVDAADLLVAGQVARETSRYVDMLYYVKYHQYSLANGIRDEGMARNVEFLLDELYPGKKIVIWAHNVHISHDFEAVSIGDFASMGRHLHESHGEEMYTIGLYMYRGRGARNDRSTYDVGAAAPGSIESIFYRTRRKHCFVDMLGERENEGNSWMFQRIGAKTWGFMDVTLVPRDQYDAILFIDTVSPPQYLTFLGNRTRTFTGAPLWLSPSH